jgi:hypothetical protein
VPLFIYREKFLSELPGKVNFLIVTPAHRPPVAFSLDNITPAIAGERDERALRCCAADDRERKRKCLGLFAAFLLRAAWMNYIEICIT